MRFRAVQESEDWGCLRVHAQLSKLTAGPAICRGRTFKGG